MRKQEPVGEILDMKISPKFNNNLLGNGNNHHGAGGNGSVFDH